MELTQRARRLRETDALRRMGRETRASKDSLILPFFIKEGKDIKTPISSMDGHFHYSPDRIHEAVEEAMEHGVDKFLLFGIPLDKDEVGTQAFHEEGVVQQGIRAIKEKFPEAYVIADTCMCEYTSHGHCGILDGCNVDNDKSLEYISKIALSQIKAGADMTAPSDMMDGRVAAIRKELDMNGYKHAAIMSYAAKYASAFYGPFREAAGSAPSFGNRKQYQMDYHNRREALKECITDIKEGSDILIVKPALSYLDIIREVKDNTNVPIAAYSVSGEFAMIKAAAKAGLIDEYGIMCETTISMLRAGSDILITYYAKEIADAIRKGDIG
ncbi:MAG: porphobilinogen synthase [Proteocatella sp.]